MKISSPSLPLGFCIIFFLALSPHLAKAQIINIEDKRISSQDSTHWLGSINLGFNLYENNGSVFTLKGGMIIEYDKGKHLWLAVNQFNLVKAEGSNFVNDGFQHVRYNFQLRPRLTYEAFAQAQYNERVRIKIRGLLGTGLRYQLLKDEAFYLGLSYMYEYEEESKSNIIRRGQRMSSYVSFSIRPSEVFSISNTSYFQPLFTNWNDLRLSSQTNILIKITNRLSFTTSFSITYDTQVPEEVTNTIYRFNNGIRWNLN